MDDILVVDDDLELCDLVSDLLTKEGFRVECVHDGESGRDRVLSGNYSLVVLDVMLPKLNGFETLRQIRAASIMTPVLMLTARGDDIDRIIGLEIGADDYLPKPFNSRELVARIRAILRRIRMETEFQKDRRVTIGDLVVDSGSRQVFIKNIAIELTAVEFGIIEILIRNVGKIVSREQIAKDVLGRELAPFDRSIDVHVSSLRKKIQAVSGEQDHIQTIRGAGYLLVLPSSD